MRWICRAWHQKSEADLATPFKCSEVPFKTANVLEDMKLRGHQAVLAWPTIPQLYVKGEFVGGCDIGTASLRRSSQGRQ